MNNGIYPDLRCLTLRLHINNLKAAEIEGNKKLSRQQIDVIGKSRVKVWGI